MREPQAAGDYDNRTTAAVKSALIEIGQIPGSFEGRPEKSASNSSVIPRRSCARRLPSGIAHSPCTISARLSAVTNRSLGICWSSQLTMAGSGRGLNSFENHCVDNDHSNVTGSPDV